MSACAYTLELAFYPLQMIYKEINRYFNVILLSQFSYIFMHTYNRRHNIDNQTSACAYAFKLAVYPCHVRTSTMVRACDRLGSERTSSDDKCIDDCVYTIISIRRLGGPKRMIAGCIEP